ncbi:Uma2 family endonuclease [soil metagenome]
MTAAPELKTSAAEYLELERSAPEKHEFLDGFVYAMAGASFNHDRIAKNLSRRLAEALSDLPCENFTSDVRVAADADAAYFYPDASALCGPTAAANGTNDTLLNPSFIAEILSESTEAFDRGDKFIRYQQIATLADYLLISQWDVSAELFQRQPDGKWLLTRFTDPDSSVPLTSLGCQIRLGDLYAKVVFEEKARQLPDRREEKR